MKQTIEEAILGRAPDVTAVEVEGLTDGPTTTPDGRPLVVLCRCCESAIATDTKGETSSMDMASTRRSELPAHTPGTPRGEELRPRARPRAGPRRTRTRPHGAGRDEHQPRRPASRSTRGCRTCRRRESSLDGADDGP